MFRNHGSPVPLLLNEVAYEKNRKTAGMAIPRNTDTLYITGYVAAGDDRAYLCDAQ